MLITKLKKKLKILKIKITHKLLFDGYSIIKSRVSKNFALHKEKLSVT